MRPFNLFVREENEVEPAPPVHCSSHNDRPTTPKSASSSGTQCTTRVRAMISIVKTKEFVKGVHELPNTKRAPRHVDADVCRCFAEALDPFMLAGLGGML